MIHWMVWNRDEFGVSNWDNAKAFEIGDWLG